MEFFLLSEKKLKKIIKKAYNKGKIKGFVLGNIKGLQKRNYLNDQFIS